jgi:hypothetical protein
VASVDRRTGSVLCHHDQRLAAASILEVLRRRDGANVVLLHPGEVPPAPAVADGPSAVARSVAAAFRSVNRDILRGTEGALDLGTLTTLGFMGAGAVEVAVKGNLPLPPWFNLPGGRSGPS